MKIIKRILLVIFIAVILAGGSILVNEWLNTKVFLTDYTFTHSEIPKSFDGYKILVISDLHQADFCREIVNHVNENKPDIIVVTGDMAQLPGTSVSRTIKIKNSVGNIPVYAVSGNHDTQGGDYAGIHASLKKAGIHMLDDTSVCIEKGGESILLTGIKDPVEDVVSTEKIENIHKKIKANHPNGPCFSILLFHRADLYPKIKNCGQDLILSGHMHGGIVRIPFVGGLVGKGEDEKYFPKYDAGLYTPDSENEASMIVSRGCDKNPDKKRYFNPPELVLVTLKAKM